MCTTNSTHDLVLRCRWCADCSKWHYKLSLRQPSAPSSRRWSVISETEWDHSPEMDEWGWSALAGVESQCRDLQRLYSELDAGVQRLF